MGINRILSIKQAENDFNLKITTAVLNYIMKTEDAMVHVKALLGNRSTDEIMRTSRPGGYIKELICDSLNLVESDDVPLYYDILNYALEIVDYNWIARTIYFSLYPEKLEELERK